MDRASSIDLYRWYLMGYALEQEFVWDKRNVGSLTTSELAAFSLGLEHYNHGPGVLPWDDLLDKMDELLGHR